MILPLSLSVSLLYLSLCLSPSLPIVSICLSSVLSIIYLIYLTTRLPHLSVILPNIYLSIHLSLYLSVYQSMNTYLPMYRASCVAQLVKNLPGFLYRWGRPRFNL